MMLQQATTSTAEQKVGIFVDAENVGGLLKNDGARTLIEIASEFGQPVIRKAYGNWKKLSANHEQTLVDRGFQLIHTPHAIPKKNAADIAMVIDVIEIQQSMQQLDCFVLVSSDSDFFQLFVHLKQAGRKVVGVCSQNSALRKRAQTTCDRFIFLDPKKRATQAVDIQEQLEEQAAREKLDARLRTRPTPLATHHELFDFLKTNTMGKAMRKRIVKLYKAHIAQQKKAPKPNPEFAALLRHVKHLRSQQGPAPPARPTKLTAKQTTSKSKHTKLEDQWSGLQESDEDWKTSLPRTEHLQDRFEVTQSSFLSREEQQELEKEMAQMRAEEASEHSEREGHAARLVLSTQPTSNSAERQHAPPLCTSSIVPPASLEHTVFLLPAANPHHLHSVSSLTPFSATFPLLSHALFRLHSLALTAPPLPPSLLAHFLGPLIPRPFMSRRLSPVRLTPPRSPALISSLLSSTWKRIASSGSTLRRATGGGAAGVVLACSFTVAAAEGLKDNLKDGRRRRDGELSGWPDGS